MHSVLAGWRKRLKLIFVLCNLLQVSQDMGIETPIPVSMRLRDLNNVFQRIVNAAQHPHLSIPETEAGKNRKQYRRLVNRSLMFVSGIRLSSCIFLLLFSSSACLYWCIYRCVLSLRAHWHGLCHTQTVPYRAIKNISTILPLYQGHSSKSYFL